MLLGAQMYTVRDFTKDLASFSETLKKIADIGYTDVQVSGTCRFEAGWLAAELKKSGLTCSITHMPQNRVLDETEAVIAEHKTFGCGYIGIGGLPGSVENYFDFRDEIMAAAKQIKAAGLQMMLHNHHREFERSGPERITYLDRVVQDFPDGELGITLDVFWAQYAGADPAAWIEKLSGRVPCVHLKDMQVIGGKQLMASVGSGNMNFPAILKACEGSGVRHLLVEQDDCNGIDPFTCLKRSFQYLTSLGLR
jgi:Sugar phosphate isomerases/epimerases